MPHLLWKRVFRIFLEETAEKARSKAEKQEVTAKTKEAKKSKNGKTEEVRKAKVCFEGFAKTKATAVGVRVLFFRQMNSRAPAPKSKWDDSLSSADEGPTKSKKKSLSKKDSKNSLPK